MKRVQNRLGESERSDNPKSEVPKRKDDDHRLLWTITTFLLALGTGGVFLAQSQHFLWWGNPDQDLVFLRDGLRIISRNQDLYSDHPGAIQSIMSAGVAWLYNATHAAGDSIQINNAERWQWSFKTLKTVNWLAYSTLWTYITYRLKSALNWPAAAAATSLSAASLATGVEIVQLRNEVYSSLLALAALSTAASWSSEGGKETTRSRAKKTADVALYSAATVASLMAKVQAIFLFAVYALFAAVEECQRKKENRYESTKLKAIASLGCSLVISFSIISMRGESWQPGELMSYGATIFLAILPAFIHLSSSSKNLRKDIVLNSIIIAALISASVAVFEWINPQWIETGLNPLLSTKYGTQYQSCSGLGCKSEALINGIQHLMKRTFHGNLSACAGGSLLLTYFTTNIVWSRSTPLKCVFALTSASVSLGLFGQGMGVLGKSISLLCSAIGALLIQYKHKSGPHEDPPVGEYLFWSSLILAGISAQRWAVDSYLIYYQPLLYLAILVEASKAKLLFSFATVYLCISTLQINSDFLRDMPFTFQRATTQDGYHWLCSRQHSGNEWRGTIVDQVDCQETNRGSHNH